MTLKPTHMRPDSIIELSNHDFLTYNRNKGGKKSLIMLTSYNYEECNLVSALPASSGCLGFK